MAKKQSVSFRTDEKTGAKILRVEYPTIGKTFEVVVSKYPAEILACAIAHGFKQKFGDAASGGTPAEKYAEVQAIHASLLAGEWERTAAPDLTPIICEAISRINKLPLKDVVKAAEKGGEEKVKTWGANPRVKAEILKIRAERAAKLADEAEEVEIDLE